MAIWHASRPTMINSKIWGRCSWRKGSGFSILERVENLINASGAIRSLPFHFFFFYTAHESLKFCFYSRLPFWVFTLEPHFFHFFSFFLIVLLCTWKFKIYPETGECVIKMILAEKQRQPCRLWKFLKEKLFSLSIHIQSKWTFRYVIWAKVHGFERKDR